MTSLALRGAAGRDDRDIEAFPEYLDDVVALMSARGVRVPIREPSDYVLKATPAAVTEPKLWLLGSSMYSAHLAAAKGLPYVFAHHFSGQGTAEALAVYRSEFRPSELASEPLTFLTVNAVVAETHDEAVALALPNLQMMARLRTGQPLGALDLVEDAESAVLTPQAQSIAEGALGRAVVGSPTEAAEQMRALADEFGVDEVMVNPAASARRGTDPATAPARTRRWNCWPKSCSRGGGGWCDTLYRCSNASMSSHDGRIVLAHQAAQSLNHDHVGTEHLLLGTVDVDEIVIGVLESHGIGNDAVRQQIEGAVGVGAEPAMGHIPFTPRAKKSSSS